MLQYWLSRLSGWHIYYGSWWMIQWSLAGWLSFGIHVDFRQRITSKLNIKYGPYVDVHLLFMILSVGVNPVYSVDNTQGRGGVLADEV